MAWMAAVWEDFALEESHHFPGGSLQALRRDTEVVLPRPLQRLTGVTFFSDPALCGGSKTKQSILKIMFTYSISFKVVLKLFLKNIFISLFQYRIMIYLQHQSASIQHHKYPFWVCSTWPIHVNEICHQWQMIYFPKGAYQVILSTYSPLSLFKHPVFYCLVFPPKEIRPFY